MARAVAEEHEHRQELLGLFGIIVQTLHEEFEASLWTELTDEGPKFGQKIVKVCETCTITEIVQQREVPKILHYWKIVKAIITDLWGSGVVFVWVWTEQIGRAHRCCTPSEPQLSPLSSLQQVWECSVQRPTSETLSWRGLQNTMRTFHEHQS